MASVPVFAFFGPSGTFTEMALDAMLDGGRVPAHLLTGGPVTRVAANSPAATLEMVRSGEADFACVPIESSVEGSVPATMDALVPQSAAQRVQAFAEVSLDIAFTIAARTAVDADAVTTIAAYPVAAAQVRRSIGELYPRAEFVPATSNAGAALDAAAGRVSACLTTAAAAGLADLVTLASDVADSRDAVTRFLLFGRPRALPEPTGADRTALILDLANRPGSLVDALNEFALRGVDLSRIESRPLGAGTAGQYRFFLDCLGHAHDAAVGEALRALHRTAKRVVFLGSWPVDRGGPTVVPDHAESLRWYTGLLDGASDPSAGDSLLSDPIRSDQGRD